MARRLWPLHRGRPQVEVTLTLAGGPAVRRRLLADTGAGTRRSGFELILDDHDCASAGGIPLQPVILGGAYTGSFPVYLIRVQLPDLGFDRHVSAVAAGSVPAGFNGIACFRFLNRFAYGNFGDPDQFGLDG
jgi:hypothetical protein